MSNRATRKQGSNYPCPKIAGLVLLTAMLNGCSWNEGRYAQAPSRTKYFSQKPLQYVPKLKVVSADTYRVCDVNGCVDNITRKTQLTFARVNSREPRRKQRQLLPPPLPLKQYSNRARKSVATQSNLKSGLLKKTARTVRKTRYARNTYPQGIIGIRFKKDQFVLSSHAKRKLEKLIGKIKRAPGVYIAGYVDSVHPSRKRRQRLLASKRAISIARYLRKRGVKGNRLKVGAYGKCCFGIKNDQQAKDKYYRRAEIYFDRHKLLRDAQASTSVKFSINVRGKSDST